MSGLFEHFAAFDEVEQIARRKAVAVAHKRVDDYVGAFLRSASTSADRAARLSLVEEDVGRIIAETVDEYGGDLDHISAAIHEHLAGDSDAEEDQESGEHDRDEDEDKDDNLPPWLQKKDKKSSIHEARRPKMCPYHSELVDASLQAGEPQYGAFSSLVGGGSHCKGGFEGSCNFRPEMVTQSYWDKKQEEYAERRKERELEQQHQEAPTPIEPIPNPDVAPPVNDGDGITDINTELEEAPSAISEGLEPAMPAMAARTSNYEVQQLGDGSGSFQVVGPSGAPSGATYDNRQDAQQAADELNKTSRTADAPRDGGGAVKTEDLPSADESGLGGPSPKIDKRKWTEENLDDIAADAEMSGTPVPTHEIDIAEVIPADMKSDFHEQIDSVTEKQDLPTADESGQSTERNVEQPHTDTFNNDGQADPVTSAVDPDKNPVREILEQDFVGDNQVESAISAYESRKK